MLDMEIGSKGQVRVRIEKPDDRQAVRVVNLSAFGRDDEADLVDALRDEGFVRMSLVAELDGRVVGHILLSTLPIVTQSGAVEALALAPLAVMLSHQRQGIGSLLVVEALRECTAGGAQIVVVLGHPEFYTRFGFSATLAEPLVSPFSGPAFMATELVPGALDGIKGEVRYPPPFGLL